MRRFLWIACCGVALLVPVAVLAGGSSRGFDAVVDALQARYQVHAERIPLLGLVSVFTRVSTRASAGNLHIADFEHFPADVDGDELNRIVQEKLGAGWERILREVARHGEEQTLIFIRPEGSRIGLFVVDRQRCEMDIVQVSVNPNHLGESIGKYGHHHYEDGDQEDSD